MGNWFILGTALVIAGWLWLRMRRRTLAIKALAEKLGFDYIGEALPRTIKLRGSILDYAHSVRNVIDGERAGMRTLTFDFTTGEGKQARRYTALATQSQNDVFQINRYGGDLTIECSDGWTFAIGRTLPVEDIDSFLESIES